MSRGEIIENLGEKSSGDISRCLEDLSLCGFLRREMALGKKRKDMFYRLMDPYVLFYFQFVENWRGNDRRHWSLNLNSPLSNAWRGYAFERVCLCHAEQIKAALGIQGVEADVYSWRWRPKNAEDEGVQIDMLIDRADGIVDLCEIKFCEDKYLIDKAEDEKIRHRAEVFRRESGVRKAVQTVLIAYNGVAPGKYRGNIQGEVSADALFDRS